MAQPTRQELDRAEEALREAFPDWQDHSALHRRTVAAVVLRSLRAPEIDGVRHQSASLTAQRYRGRLDG